MAIRRKPVKPEQQYTIVANEWARDERISLKARGLLTLILSHRVGWNVTIEALARTNPEGKAAIRSAVHELEEAGYLQRERAQGEDGKFAGYDYVLSYEPSCDFRTPPFDYPTTENPTTENPTTENRTPKKNISKKTREEEDHPVESAPSGATHGQRLPEGWHPAPETIAQMRQEKPGVDLQAEHRKFTDYWKAAAGAKGRKADWEATWRNWIRNARPGPRSAEYKPGWQKRLEHAATEHQRYQAPPPGDPFAIER